MQPSEPSPHSRHPRPAGIVIFTDVDCVLRHDGIPSLAGARSSLDALAASGSPVVLCSARPAADLLQLQHELGLHDPFISDGGQALYIPVGYFCGTTDADPPTGYERIDFGARRIGHAVRLLVSLYRSWPEPPLVVGIGSDWRDRALLHEVDVPIVIRDASVDQAALLRNLPNAYVTQAAGREGWSEAILGYGSAGSA